MDYIQNILIILSTVTFNISVKCTFNDSFNYENELLFLNIRENLRYATFLNNFK